MTNRKLVFFKMSNTFCGFAVLKLLFFVDGKSTKSFSDFENKQPEAQICLFLFKNWLLLTAFCPKLLVLINFGQHANKNW
jgi:hypothetical protein